MNSPNATLAYQILDHIDAHPEQWDQGEWIAQSECGTVGCFAGWACLLSGDKPHLDVDGEATGKVMVHGIPVFTRDRANDLLGIDPYRGCDLCGKHYEDCCCISDGRVESDGLSYLFNSENSRHRLGDLVRTVFGPRPDTTEAVTTR